MVIGAAQLENAEQHLCAIRDYGKMVSWVSWVSVNVRLVEIRRRLGIAFGWLCGGAGGGGLRKMAMMALISFPVVGVLGACVGLPGSDVVARFDADEDRWGGLLFVDVEIKGVPCRFVLDTGATVTGLNEMVIHDNNLVESGYLTLDGYTGKVAQKTYSLDVLKVGAERIVATPPLQVVSTDFSLMEKALGRPIDGVLGLDVLSHYIVSIDRKNKVGRLFHSRALLPFDIADYKKYRIDSDFMVEGVELDGISLKGVVIDTGSQGSGIAEQVLRGIQVSWEEGVSKAFDARGESMLREITFPKIRLNNQMLNNVVFDIVGRNVVGANVLREYSMVIDYPGRMLYMKKE